MTTLIRLEYDRRRVRIKIPPVPSVALKLERMGPRGPLGPEGPAGPDPWLAAVQDVSGQGVVNLFYSAGKHIRLTLLGDITQLNVTGWPIANRVARLTLEITNTGNFGILSWPAGSLWQGGITMPITQGAGAKDRFVLSTTDAGATIFVDAVGFDYR